MAGYTNVGNGIYKTTLTWSISFTSVITFCQANFGHTAGTDCFTTSRMANIYPLSLDSFEYAVGQIHTSGGFPQYAFAIGY